MERKIRVLVAKLGLDGHDLGAKVVARALRDAGLDAIYTGLHQTPDMIANAAVQEDVDVVGLSLMSGAHPYLVPEIVKLLKEKGAGDIPILLGGIIPNQDYQEMTDAGVRAILTPGATLAQIVELVKEAAESKWKNED